MSQVHSVTHVPVHSPPRFLTMPRKSVSHNGERQEVGGRLPGNGKAGYRHCALFKSTFQKAQAKEAATARL